MFRILSDIVAAQALIYLGSVQTCTLPISCLVSRGLVCLPKTRALLILGGLDQSSPQHSAKHYDVRETVWICAEQPYLAY